MATVLYPVRQATLNSVEGCVGNVFAAPGLWDMDTNGIKGLSGAGVNSLVLAGFTEGGSVDGTWTITSVAGTTSGLAGGAMWLSYPLSADVTISGQITFVMRGDESSMNANATIKYLVFKMAAATGALTTIIESSFGTEMTTTYAQKTWNGTPGAGVACKKGDRLLIIGGWDDATATTMGSGFTLESFSDVNATGAGVDGFTFTETLTFDSGTPAGTTFYLQDAASDLAGSGQKTLGRVPGDGTVNTSVTNTATGPTAGIQVTDTAGGNVVEWLSPQLQAFSLTGKVNFNIWCKADNTSAKATVRAELAVTDSDGTGAVTVSTALVALRSGSATTQLDATIRAAICKMGVATTSVTDGQRLRLRLFVDENYYSSATFPLVTGHTVTIDYDGTTAAADGDSFITLTETVSDFTPATATLKNTAIDFADPALV
jgi:hypothetical protein